MDSYRHSFDLSHRHGHPRHPREILDHHVIVGDQEFFASKCAEVYEDAVSQACEALERQIKKAKDKSKA